MDPYDEQSLTEEVLYLHSLWHQGPPTQRPPLHLHPSSLHDLSNRSNISKKPSKKSRGREYQKKLKILRQLSEQQPVKEWPVNPTSISSPASTSGWPTPLPKTLLLPSPEEQARLAASQAQAKALNATVDFFSSDDYLDDMDEDDDDDDDEREKIQGFFVNLFTEDCGLKEYYLKNYWNGEFNCLVCGWTLKKYKDCAALVQHSNSIAKKRRVHRAYGQAVCNLLGWEIDKLPQIISDLAAKVNESLNKSSVCTAEAQEAIAADTKESSSILANDELQQNELAESGNVPNTGDSGISEETIAADTKESSSILVNDEEQKKESAESGNVPNTGDSGISEEPKVEASACEGEAKNDGPADA